MWTLSQRKYAQSVKGLEARKRFQQSDKGKALRAKYLAKRKTKLQELKKQKVVVENKTPKQPKVEVKIQKSVTKIIK